MALKIGQYYTVQKDGEVLYYDSGMADTKNTWSKPTGSLTKGDKHEVVNVYFGTGNGSPNQTDGPGKTPLYGLRHKTESYAIGWVRDEGASVTGANIYGLPSSISTSSTGFRVTLEGTVGVTFDITATIGTTQIYSASGTMAYATGYWDLSFDATARSKMVTAIGSYSSRTMTVKVVSKHGGSTIRTSSATTTVTAPPRAVAKAPVWTKNPVITFTNEKDGKVYENQTSINVSFSTSDLRYDTGARFYTSYITIGDTTEYTTTSYSRVPNKSGELKITVGVGDTNGKWTHFTRSVTVEVNASISIDTFTANRSGDSGVSLAAQGSFTPASETPSGTKLTYSIEKRVRGTSTWVSVEKDKNPTTSSDTWSVALNQSSGYDGSKSYDFRLTIVGAVSTASGTSIMGTEAIPMSWGQHGSGVGVMFNNSNSASLQVGDGGIDSLGPIYSQGKLVTGGGQWEVKTQSQYNALTTGQKNDPTKLYLIKL